MPIIIELAQGLLRRFAPWIVIAALVLAMAIAGPAACRKLHTDQARARLGEEQARAASNATSGRKRLPPANASWPDSSGMIAIEDWRRSPSLASTS